VDQRPLAAAKSEVLNTGEHEQFIIRIGRHGF